MTSTEFLKRDQLSAAKAEFNRLWHKATAEQHVTLMGLGARAYFTAKLLAWKVFEAARRGEK